MQQVHLIYRLGARLSRVFTCQKRLHCRRLGRGGMPMHAFDQLLDRDRGIA